MRSLCILLGIVLLFQSVPAADRYGGTLHIGHTVAIETLDPHRINVFYPEFDSSVAVVNQIFEGLVQYTSGTAEIEPLLAESWDISEDGLVYTFHLRKNVYWQDGNQLFAEGESRALKAEDIVYSWNRVTAPETWSPMQDFFSTTAAIESWQSKGAHTFEVTLKQPNPSFLYMLPFPCFSIIPKEVVQYKIDDFQPVGTGPFEVTAVTNQVVLHYNEDYWKGEPYFTEIQYRMVNSENLVSEFKKGTIDWCLIPPESWEEFSAYNRVTVPQFEILYLGMNCRKNPFSDKRVRQAINYALDCSAALDDIYKGQAVQAVSILPPGLVCHTQRGDMYSRNLEKAAQLLDEAGYTKNPRLTIELKSSESYTQQQFNTIYQEQLKEIDVELEVTYLEVSSLLHAVDTGDTQLFTLGWRVDWPYPDQFLFLFHSKNWGPGGNSCFYANKEVDTLLEKAQKEPDIDHACGLYQQVEELILEDAVWVLQWRRVNGYAVQEWIHGFNPGGMGDKYETLGKVWISADHRQTTRIPQNTGEAQEGIPLYYAAGVGVVLMVALVLVLRKRT